MVFSLGNNWFISFHIDKPPNPESKTPMGEAADMCLVVVIKKALSNVIERAFKF